jgi:hypothetical protein
MNPWTRVGVDEPGSRVEGGEPVLCDYAQEQLRAFYANIQEDKNKWVNCWAIKHKAKGTNMPVARLVGWVWQKEK